MNVVIIVLTHDKRLKSVLFYRLMATAAKPVNGITRNVKSLHVLIMVTCLIQLYLKANGAFYTIHDGNEFHNNLATFRDFN